MVCKKMEGKISPALTVTNSVDCRGGGVCDSSLGLCLGVKKSAGPCMVLLQFNRKNKTNSLENGMLKLEGEKISPALAVSASVGCGKGGFGRSSLGLCLRAKVSAGLHG